MRRCLLFAENLRSGHRQSRNNVETDIAAAETGDDLDEERGPPVGADGRTSRDLNEL